MNWPGGEPDEPSATRSPGGAIRAPLAGGAFGELDPLSSGNRLIQDLLLARDPDGKVRDVTTFELTRSVNPARRSRIRASKSLPISMMRWRAAA